LIISKFIEKSFLQNTDTRLQNRAGEVVGKNEKKRKERKTIKPKKKHQNVG
jgi:hypothetical protein